MIADAARTIFEGDFLNNEKGTKPERHSKQSLVTSRRDLYKAIILVVHPFALGQPTSEIGVRGYVICLSVLSLTLLSHV